MKNTELGAVSKDELLLNPAFKLNEQRIVFDYLSMDDAPIVETLFSFLNNTITNLHSNDPSYIKSLTADEMEGLLVGMAAQIEKLTQQLAERSKDNNLPTKRVLTVDDFARIYEKGADQQREFRNRSIENDPLKVIGDANAEKKVNHQKFSMILQKQILGLKEIFQFNMLEKISTT